MPKYYFDFYDGDREVFRDDQGTNLPDSNAAHVEAAGSLTEFAKDTLLIGPGEGERELKVKVRDADGRVILQARLHFESEVL